MEYAGQRYVRIAHGSKAKQCPINRLFRVIVITEINDAYFRLAPPLLNRFEKQIFLRKDLMERADEALLNRLYKFWGSLTECLRDPKDRSAMGASSGAASSSAAPALVAGASEEDTEDKGVLTHKPIAGFHNELLSSLVFMLRRRSDNTMSMDQLFDEAKRLLTLVLTPEAACITAASLDAQGMHSKFGFNLVEEYFENQRHSDLPSFAELLVKDSRDWCDSLGAQVMVLTYSPIRGKIGQELSRIASSDPEEISLHELSSSQDIEKSVQRFYDSAAEGTPGKRFMLIHADPVAASSRMIEHCRFVCEKSRTEFVKRGKGTPGSMFVILVVHLQRGLDTSFSFDYDSRWHFVFLDSVEPSGDLNSMPSLGRMLNMPLIDVVSNLDFSKLLQSCFRASLSRLIYPHSRRPEDLQRQIHSILGFLEDEYFVTMVRTWILLILRQTPKNAARMEDGTVGQDRNWFAAIASAAHELALAGTFRAALHNRIAVLVGSLLTVLLAHLDRNGGLALLGDASKRKLWLSLSEASLTSDLSARLHNEAITATQEHADAQHEVGTDAQTGARPFASRFPTSWFVSRSIDGVRHVIETLPKDDQMAAIATQYKLSKLHEVGLEPELQSPLLDDYLADFTAMHLDWTSRIDRDTQTRILKKTLQRVKGGELRSILEVHKYFWNQERQVAYCVNLLNAVPGAVSAAEELIDKAELGCLNLDLLLLVHQTLTAELQNVQATGPEGPHSFYREWLSQKMVVAGLTKDLLADYNVQAHEKMAQLKCSTEPRTETLSLFLEYVAVPLNLPLDNVKQLAKELPDGKIRQSKTLSAILATAKTVATNDSALAACGAFLESWVLDVCLRDAEAISDLEEDCLRLVCSMSAGLPVVIHSMLGVSAGNLSEWSEHQECGIATLGSTNKKIPRSECLNLALLRKLLVSSEGEARKKATARIEELLREVSEHEKHNDTTFATRYTVLCEEFAAAELSKLTGPSEWPELSLHEVFKRPGVSSPAYMLQDVGKIRWLLNKYAKILCVEKIDLELHAAAVSKVSNLLQTDDDSLAPVCRSLRLYLLKCIERSRGISFLRGLLAEMPLCKTGWVEKWRGAHDIDFEKFIGAALVPKWNPWLGEDGTPEYREAKIAVMEMMTSTATDKLDKYARDCKMHDIAQQKKDVAGLLLALCQEPGLLAALEEEDRKPPWRTKLNEWLEHTSDLPVTPKERMLLRIFAGDAVALQSVPSPHWEYLGPFAISGGRRMDDLLRWRVLGHLAAVLISAPKASVLSALRKIMLEPEDLMYGENTYLPGMDEDIRNRVMKALLERGESIWKFKTHWYKCSCGYNFFIGECGRPMEMTQCPQCGLTIGGKDHNKTTATVEDDEKDRSPQGYMLPCAEKDEKHISFREVPSSSARAVRLLLHGAMFCGIAASAGDPLPRIFDHLVNRDSMCTMHQESEAKYIGEHFGNDWTLMVGILSSNVEDLAAGLHNLLRKMNFETKDDPKSGSSSEMNWEKLSLETRNKWEETIEAKYLNKMVSSFASPLVELYKKWGGAEEDGKFVTELKEAADVRDFPRHKREAEMPQLWAYRTPVTLDMLHARMGVVPDAQQKLPVLCTVLQRPLFNILPALGLLVGVFEWHSLVINRFSGRITRNEAGQLKVGKVLESIQHPTERQQWERAYAQFEKAWRIAWPHIERHECLEIPQHFRSVVIDRETSMLFCIADPDNEGICPLALTQWLAERHNELVQVVSAAIVRPSKGDAANARQGVRQSPAVSSRLLGQHDVVKYDEQALMHFLKSRCVTYGVGGGLNFDFKQLEQQLRRELARPEITMELRGFQWLGESHAQTSELKAVIKQKDLPPDVIERIKAELISPSLAHRCLQKVQMAVSFIQKSGSFSGEHAGETKLCGYLSSVLAESPDCIPSAAARSEVYLWHLSAFDKLLKQIINKDPMDDVDLIYRSDLPTELARELDGAKPSLPPTLATEMADFAEAYLTENVLNSEETIVSTLTYWLEGKCEPDTDADGKVSPEDAAVARQAAQDRDAVQMHLPPDLLMKHWVSTYYKLRA